MSCCGQLGFADDGSLRLSKSSDIEELLPFPSTYDFTGYTGELQIRETYDAVSALLTVTDTATANGSIIVFDGRYITLRIKAADAALLPDADDPNDPWVGVYEWVLTDPTGLTTRLVDGALIAEKGVVR